MRKKNLRNRYRISDTVAKRLGLALNKGKRYRLNKTKEEQFLGMKIKRLFFDIETSPMQVYSWRIGYKINLNPENIIEYGKIICISYKWEGEDEVYHLTWDKNQCDKEIIAAFIKEANKADEIVAQNGDHFDIRWLKARAVYHRLPMFPKYRTLDTFKKAKQVAYFPSFSLDAMAKYFGVGAKMSHSGFKMWKDVMNGDQKALDEMVAYCDQDVIVLEDVFHVLQPYIQPNTNVSVHTGGEKYGCPICGENHELTLLKNDVTPKGSIRRVLECQCGYVYDVANCHYLKFIDR